MSAEEYFTPDEIAEARRYPLVIHWSEEDQLFLVSLPDFGGVTSHGRIAAEAAERGVEMAAEWIDSYRQLGRPIPAPSSALEPVASRAA
jgi:predicted RNase H-like HicB family nuclease